MSLNIGTFCKPRTVVQTTLYRLGSSPAAQPTTQPTTQARTCEGSLITPVDTDPATQRQQAVRMHPWREYK